MVSEAEKVQKKTKCEHQAECMKLVQLIVDGQATDEQIADFKANMNNCLPCEKGYELEKCIKESLQLRLEKKCVPQDLVDCIKSNIGKMALLALIISYFITEGNFLCRNFVPSQTATTIGR